MSDYAIEARGLSKNYGRLKAVDRVSFNVERGISFGLLGLNGAGKTTTFKMLVSLIRPDGGSALVDGYDVAREPMKVRGRIGYVAENPSFYPRMTTLETLRYLARLLNVPAGGVNSRIDQVLQLTGLDNKRNEYVGTYSRGMRHRLALAQALLSEPAVLFLDEPTLGLDPLGAKNMRELIQRLQAERDVTIMMSSHVLPEVEAICSEVGIFDHGRLLARDSIENLRASAGDEVHISVRLVRPHAGITETLRRMEGVRAVVSDGASLRITAARKPEMRPAILKAITGMEPEVLFFGGEENNLESILLGLLNQERSRAGSV